MVNNHCLAKSINDASWYMFRVWLNISARYSEELQLPCQPMERVKNALAAERLLRKVYQREPTLVGVDAC